MFVFQFTVKGLEAVHLFLCSAEDEADAYPREGIHEFVSEEFSTEDLEEGVFISVELGIEE